MMLPSDSRGVRFHWLSLLMGACLLLAGCAERRWLHAPATGFARPDPTVAPAARLQAPTPALSIPDPPRPLAQEKPRAAGPALTPAVNPDPKPQPANEQPAPVRPSREAGVDPEAPLRDLLNKAVKTYGGMDSYLLRLRRREMVGDQKMPEEVMLLKHRQDPFSVYFKWLGPEGKGREVVYVKGHYGNQLHVRLAAGDILFMPAGKRMSFALDSSLVRAKSRYPITEAGLGPLIARFGRLVEAIEKGDPGQGTGKYLGQVKRPEYEEALHVVLQTMPPKCDPALPRGGQRHWFFDRELHLPMLVITHDDAGREVEYYCHDRLQSPVGLERDDFNPDVIWKARQ